MNKPLRAGLVGAGGYGAAHLRALEGLAAEGSATLAAVAEPQITRYPGLKERLEELGARAYPDLAALLAREELDALFIAAPIPYHVSMTKAALQRDLFVYLEKPPAPLIQQLDELISLDSRQQVAVGFQLIHLAAVRQLKSWIVEGKLGAIRSIRAAASGARGSTYYGRARWAGRIALDGEAVLDGPMTNAMSHLLHNIMFLGGKEATGFASPINVQAELYRAGSIESYDTSCLRGLLDSGPSFSFAVTHAAEETMPNTILVTGTKGSASIKGTLLESDPPLAAPLLPGNESSEPMRESFRSFIRYAAGETARPGSLLRDARGYVLATNGAFLSSGKIHSIGADYTRQYLNKEETAVDVPGLVPLLTACVEEGSLFSQSGPPWTVQRPSVHVEDLRSLPLEACLGA